MDFSSLFFYEMAIDKDEMLGSLDRILLPLKNLTNIFIMKSNYFFSIAIAAALLINCKGKDGAPGPSGKDGTTGANGKDGATGTPGKDGATGPTGPAPTITEQSFLTKEGFMKATLTAMVEGVSTVFNFDFQGNFIGESGTYTVNSATETRIAIYKQYASDGEVYKEGAMSLSFTIDNLTSLKNAKFDNFYVNASKQITPQKLIDISMGASPSSNPIGGPTSDDIVITDLKYDATTNIISGKFSGMVSGYTQSGLTEKRSITNGSFSAFIKQKVSAARRSN